MSNKEIATALHRSHTTISRELKIGKNHKSALGTLLERKTRLVILVPLKENDSKTVRESFVDVFEEIDPGMRQSKTYDRGLEMAYTAPSFLRHGFAVT